MVFWKCHGLCTFFSKLVHGSYCLCSTVYAVTLTVLCTHFPTVENNKFTQRLFYPITLDATRKHSIILLQYMYFLIS